MAFKCFLRRNNVRSKINTFILSIGPLAERYISGKLVCAGVACSSGILCGDPLSYFSAFILRGFVGVCSEKKEYLSNRTQLDGF